jgi:hypothetical protein
MINDSVASDAFVSPPFRRVARAFLSAAVPAVVALGLSAMGCVWILQRLPPSAAAPEFVRTPAVASAAVAPKPIDAANPVGALFDPGFSEASAQFSAAQHPAPYGVLFDPAFFLGSREVLTAQLSSPGSRFEPVAPVIALATPAAPQSAPPAPKQTVALLDERAPLPPARPAEWAAPAAPSAVPPAIARHLALNGKPAAPAEAPPADNRNFFEKLFGGAGATKTSGPPLAYASAEEGGLFGGVFSGASGPSARYDRYTAVYDLAAHTVYLPNGAKLEAHSGLGDRRDDPTHVSERNRGATPPHVYELASMDGLFHGVQALRLNPVGGDGAIFGRDGLLAHSYMLGPHGDSNGCVSFRDYEAFLQAYQSGQVKRLAVVASLD